MKTNYLFLFIFLFFISLITQNCKTTGSSKSKILVETLAPKNENFTEKSLAKKELEIPKVLKIDKVSNFLKHANSIKILSYSIESPDFATQLFREKLKGKEIELLISKFSIQNYRSKINYLKQIDLDPTLIALSPQLENESFIILDDSFILKNIFIPLNHNKDPEIESFKIETELSLFESCKLSPQNCFENFKPHLTQKDLDNNHSNGLKQKGTLNFVLPSKTKREKFLESD